MVAHSLHARSQVALLTPRFPPDRGGVASAAARLARGLNEHLELDVIALGKGGFAQQAEQIHGLRVSRLIAPSLADAQARCFDLLRDRGPYRLVHAIYPSLTGFPGRFYAGYVGVPLLVSVRGNDLIRDSFRPEHQFGLCEALRQADSVVGVSQELCRMAEALGARRTQWIPNGVDTALFRFTDGQQPLRHLLGIETHSPVIALVGEARPKKGLAIVLDALARLLSAWPAARLLLIGGLRQDAVPLVDAWRRKNPAASEALVEVPWMDQEDLPAYYSLADVIWHPSVSDGLPNAVLEAMACERPILATAVGGILDIAAGSRLSDWLSARPHAAELVALTDRLLRLDETQRRELGSHYRAHVARHFRPGAEVDAYLGLYDRLAASPANQPTPPANG